MTCRDMFGGRLRRGRVFCGVPLCALLAAVVVAVTSSPTVAAPASRSASGGQPPIVSAPLARRVPGTPGGGSGTAALRQVIPRPVREIVADRTAVSSTWQNANGTITVRRYLAPHFYRSGSGWLPVGPVLAPTSGRPGWWHSEANSYGTVLGPAGAADGAEQLSVDGAQFGFSPLHVSDPSLTPEVSGATAIYHGLWPGVDLDEQVSASGVKEGIVLSGPGAGSSFGFRVLGATARADAAGGLEVLAGGRQVGVIPPLTVTAARAQPGRSAPGDAAADVTAVSGARLSVTGDVVRVSVSPGWLAGLPSWAFPVTIDPTTNPTSNQTQLVSVAKDIHNQDIAIHGTMQNGCHLLR